MTKRLQGIRNEKTIATGIRVNRIESSVSVNSQILVPCWTSTQGFLLLINIMYKNFKSLSIP